METAREAVRHLVGIVQPWSHYSSNNDLNPSTEREMWSYVNREDLFTDDMNKTTTMSNSTTMGSDMLDDEPAAMSPWHTLASMLGFFFLIFFTLILKDGILRICGLDCCEPQQGRPLVPPSSQDGDPDLEASLSPEEMKEKRLEKQRIERRLWYSYYLKPYTTVLTGDHFITDAKEGTRDIEEGLANDGESAADGEESIERTAPQEPTFSQDEALEPPSGVMCVVDSDDLDEHDGPSATTDVTAMTLKESISATDAASTDIEKQDHPMMCQPVRVGSRMMQSEDEDGEAYPTKWMTIWDSHDTTYRKVEANCSICILDYEEGDTIVQSGADEEEEYCIHVFHKECMLQWLSHGRKRCPICRRWFVPAVRIKEQMKQAHVVTRGSLHHLYDSRTMEDVVSLSEETETEEMSGSIHPEDATDDVEHTA